MRTLEAHVLDAGRNDYYGHGHLGDVQDSTFLERLDSPDRTAPTVRRAFRTSRATDRLRAPLLAGPPGRCRAGDVPVYQTGVFVGRVPNGAPASETRTEARRLRRSGDRPGRATERAGPPRGSSPGAGMVDPQGRLIRDTVRRPRSRGVTIKRTATAWPCSGRRPRCRRHPGLPRQGRLGSEPPSEADDHPHARSVSGPRFDRGRSTRRQRRPGDDSPAAPPAVRPHRLPRSAGASTAG